MSPNLKKQLLRSLVGHCDRQLIVALLFRLTDWLSFCDPPPGLGTLAFSRIDRGIAINKLVPLRPKELSYFARNVQIFPHLSSAEMASRLLIYLKIIVLPRLDKGKPRESVGHKATGLKPNQKGHGSRVAKRAQCLLRSVIPLQP